MSTVEDPLCTCGHVRTCHFSTASERGCCYGRGPTGHSPGGFAGSPSCRCEGFEPASLELDAHTTGLLEAYAQARRALGDNPETSWHLMSEAKRMAWRAELATLSGLPQVQEIRDKAVEEAVEKTKRTVEATIKDLRERLTRTQGERDFRERKLKDEQDALRRMQESYDVAAKERAHFSNEYIKLERVVQEFRTQPIPLILHCPECTERHIDPPDMAPHRTHACQSCGFLWAPAVVATVGVQFLPGCKSP